MYDLIGDIHGHASELKSLLTKLDYREIDGVWQHPTRQVIFLGDFVDRGPQQIETVSIARNMVENGRALAVMGNHEFNAVAWATEDPQNLGEYLRPHTAKNRKQHQAFLEQAVESSELHCEIIEWFKTLPLFLEMDTFRVVHACWHPDHLQTLANFTDDNNCVRSEAWAQLTDEGSEGFEALETVLKGLEISLPSGCEFRDKDNHPRTNIRTRWWDLDGITYRDLAMVPAEVIDQIPHEPIPNDVLPGYDGKKPVFVGHYWMKGEPKPLNEHVACLDYSVVDPDGGKLCAYRHDYSKYLDTSRFCWVVRRSRPVDQ
ncbi:metallophosphoesterase [Marinobacter salarius]|uniref:metallophosphoesterase n=1 Tax=Marinobacter salarius TaxID=1420917 RepID=UPI0018F111E8|nr:metallophosphoesterase [Marinobacter salarius]MBJ7276211.1 metallophosphoesterase [Marinobacter salarius]|tara:strand:+ start:216 stop:1163 length:948 start_codon:yes stop_codon:yes gene_type:complete